MALVIVLVVLGALALVVIALRHRSGRADEMPGEPGERPLGNHYVGGEVPRTPHGQGWGGR